MAYNERALEMRRCRAVTGKYGWPCGNYAVWGDPSGRGGSHGGRRRVIPRQDYRTMYEPCRCEAYAWPHRPGGGLCCWPDPPQWICTLPAGTHSLGYTRSSHWR